LAEHTARLGDKIGYEHCNNPKISRNIFWKFMIFFLNFGRVSLNLAYPKLSTKSTSIPNQTFPQFNVLIILQHMSINNISLSLTYQLK
jgi:hypothetical protein